MTDWQKMWAEMLADTSEPPGDIRKLTDATLRWITHLEEAHQELQKHQERIKKQAMSEADRRQILRIIHRHRK